MGRKNKRLGERVRAVPDLPFRLREFRERKGISLDDIAETTKISVHFLQSIEAGAYAQLPGGIFNTNYLRQYAVAIGYEPDELLEHYRRQTGVVEKPEEERRKGGFFSRWFDLATHSRS